MLAGHERLKKLRFDFWVSSISSAVVHCILTPNHSGPTRVL